MLTRDQEYAIAAHEKVKAVYAKYTEVDRRRYGATAHKLPFLIHSAGLAQALIFVETRGKGNDNPYKSLLQDLKATINPEQSETLAQRAREAELDEYMQLTQQVLDALLWYKRFAQSILGVDASTIIEEEGS